MQQQLLIADRMASIGMLAAGVAHEVNNPLAYVLNNIEIAIKGLAPLGEAASQSREVLGVALEGVDRIRTIVRDLLAFSRVDDAAIGPISVLDVVESTLALAGKDIAERAVLTFEHEPVVPVAGSVARLGQVLLNLITNALESMRSNVRADNSIHVVVRPSGAGGAVIEVTDNGVGIPVEHAARIFDPFFTTKPMGKGTGLGLAISQRLVAEMHGHLTFESAPLRGSTFRVTLATWEPTRS
jgi:signal transduction histidine kinase